MICLKCNSKIEDDSQFCPFCGEKIEKETVKEKQEQEEYIPPHSDKGKEIVGEAHIISNHKCEKSIRNKLKQKIANFWKKRSLYERFLIITLIVFCVMCLVAFLVEKPFAGIISILSMVLVIVALLINKQIIKVPKKWYGIIFVLLAFALIVPYVSMFNPSTPSEQGYDVKIKVKCVENLIFAKYDVQVYLNDSLKGTIKNGKTLTLSETLQEGHYELKFVNKDDSEITATVKFDIKQEESLEYQITCSVWDISVKTIAGTTYKEKDEQSEKSKIKMTEDAKKYVGNPSAQVKKAFEEKGFTNVKIQQVTTTDSKNVNSTVKEVLVNGKGFVKGDTFEKDASIIIYCWKLEQSVESKIEMTEDAERYAGNPAEHVKKDFEDKGFTNVKVQQVSTTDEANIDGTVKEVLVNGKGFVEGDTFRKNVEIIIYCWKLEPKIEMTQDAEQYVGKQSAQVKKEFEDKGFTSIKIQQVITTDAQKADNTVKEVLVNGQGFVKGDTFKKDVEIIIYYWKYEAPLTSQLVLPKEGSKLAKDFDTKSEYTIYYMNSDNISNKPKIKKWGSATVTDGVAEYLDYLQSIGFTVTITKTTTREPHAGFHVYETDFMVSSTEISWTMYLNIQNEAYVEYELDIHLDSVNKKQ